MKFVNLTYETMNLWNAFVSYYCHKEPVGDDFDYDFSYDFMTRPLEQLERKVMMAIKDDECVGYFHKSKVMGLDCFYIGKFKDQYLHSAINAIKRIFPKALMGHSEYYLEQKVLASCGYEQVNDKSISYVDEESQKPYRFNSIYHYMTTGNKDILVEKLEKHLFPEIDGDISYDVMSGNELNAFLHTNSPLPYGESVTWTNSYNNNNIPGFRYLNYNTIHTHMDDVKYLVAHKDWTIIGVICFGIWPYTKDHQSMSYIDVALPYRKKGIATQMIKELDKHLVKNLDLHLSPVSDTGKACNIADLFKKHIKSVKCYSYEEMMNR